MTVKVLVKSSERERELGTSVEEMGGGGRREMGDRRWRETGDGRRELGDGRRETGDLVVVA